MKKSKLNFDGTMKQYEQMLPDDIKGDYIAGLTACKDAIGGEKNACEAAQKFIICFQKNNPKFMFV